MLPFSYQIFLHRPISTLAFIALFLGLLSLWVYRRVWVWGFFLGISLLFALMGKVIAIQALLPIGLLLGVHLWLHYPIRGLLRLILVLIATVISLALSYHVAYGFFNWALTSSMKLSSDALPYTYYLNYDKPFIGFFILALNLPLLEDRIHYKTMLVRAIPLSLVGLAILIYLALHFQLIKFDFKLVYFLPIWIVSNLFLTVIPEEAFYRGFLQREICEHLHNKWAGVLSILVVSIGFALMHYKFIDNYFYIGMAFVASVIYGSIYHATKSIESSILCHAAFNIAHMIFFTYPIIQA